ncbi:MAG: S41 family peptidase [Bacteroidaceae bacterium]|nr:S41 family peptidase [Bacteroidaceae bacterium]
MKRYGILILLFGALLLGGCVSEETFEDTPEGNLEALWQIIDERYCFLDYKAQAIGLDWDAVRLDYRRRLSPSMTRLQLFEVLCGMLGELRDGHVNLYCSADVGRDWSWKDDYPANLDHEVRESYLGTDYRIAAGLRYRILDDNIGYAVFDDFSSGLGDGNLDDALYYLRLCDGLIIDVRGNGGGLLSTAERFSSRFTNEKRLVGYISHKRGKGHSDFSKPMAEYLEPSKRLRWQKPAIVLTNRECFSATNTFVRNMQQCPLVRTLGDQTGGGSGMPFNSELPNGWLVRYSACVMYDAQMQQIEFGIPPDIPCSLDSADVARGRDTLIETARMMLRK